MGTCIQFTLVSLKLHFYAANLFCRIHFEENIIAAWIMLTGCIPPLPQLIKCYILVTQRRHTGKWSERTVGVQFLAFQLQSPDLYGQVWDTTALWLTKQLEFLYITTIIVLKIQKLILFCHKYIADSVVKHMKYTDSKNVGNLFP